MLKTKEGRRYLGRIWLTDVVGTYDYDYSLGSCDLVVTLDGGQCDPKTDTMNRK